MKLITAFYLLLLTLFVSPVMAQYATQDTVHFAGEKHFQNIIDKIGIDYYYLDLILYYFYLHSPFNIIIMDYPPAPAAPPAPPPPAVLNYQRLLNLHDELIRSISENNYDIIINNL